MNEWKRESPQNRTQKREKVKKDSEREKEKQMKKIASHKIEKRDGPHSSTSSSCTFINVII